MKTEKEIIVIPTGFINRSFAMARAKSKEEELNRCNLK